MLEMADVLSAPAEDFVRLWVQYYDQRAVGAFATSQACIEHICRTLGLQPDDWQIERAAQARLDLTQRALVPRTDAIDTISTLRALDYRIGLISDCSSEVPVLWGHTPFAPLIDAPIFSCSSGLKKPDPRIYWLACERLRVDPGRCIYVGDGGSRELTGAAEVGMRPVLIRIPDIDKRDPHVVDADEWQGTTISSLKDILTLL